MEYREHDGDGDLHPRAGRPPLPPPLLLVQAEIRGGSLGFVTITLLHYYNIILQYYIITNSFFEDKILSSTIYATKPHYIKIWKYF